MTTDAMPPGTDDAQVARDIVQIILGVLRVHGVDALPPATVSDMVEHVRAFLSRLERQAQVAQRLEDESA